VNFYQDSDNDGANLDVLVDWNQFYLSNLLLAFFMDKNNKKNIGKNKKNVDYYIIFLHCRR